MKKTLYLLLAIGLLLSVSSCKRSEVNDPPWDDPAGFNVILEGTANPAILFVDGVIHASQINVVATDVNGNPLAGRTILFEQCDSLYAQIAWGYFENTLATIQKTTDGAGRTSATFYGPTSLPGTQMYVRALMIVNGRSYGDNPPQDFVALELKRVNFQNYGPVVAITSPIDGASVSGSVTVTATAIDEEGVAQVEFYVDGKLLSTVAGSTTSDTYTFTWDSTLVDNGTHAIKVVAYDGMGKKGQDEISVEVSGNNIAPVVTITAPPAGATVSGSVTISAVATDAADGIQTVECYIDGNLIGSSPGSTSSDTYTFTWDTSQYSNRDHTITVTAIDNAGMSASDSRRVTVNNTSTDAAPTVSITYPVSATTITLPSGETTITIRANAEDDKGVNRVELFVNNVFEDRMSRSNTLYRYTFTVPASGSYSFYAIAYDTINQMTTSTTVTVTINLTP